jgi:hypothetical protein
MTDVAAVSGGASTDGPLLKLHLEPGAPIEVGELTAALGSISRQYQRFATEEGFADQEGGARLLVSNVSPGSIDISFLPDFYTAAGTAATLFTVAYDRYELMEKFAKRVKRVLDFFLGDEGKTSGTEITVRDCDDATNIVNPIAQHGGTQSITVINGPVINNPVLVLDAKQARHIVERSAAYKGDLLSISGERRQRVAMIWTRLDRDAAKTDGKRSPDHGIIADIDPKPHPVFFTDDMSYIKREMIDDQENPYQKVFFVDVEISKIPGGRVGSYKIIGYHGSEDLETSSTSETPLPFA